jgi:hypothetical protein
MSPIEILKDFNLCYLKIQTIAQDKDWQKLIRATLIAQLYKKEKILCREKLLILLHKISRTNAYSIYVVAEVAHDCVISTSVCQLFKPWSIKER